ncbi:RHS repeat-associated core domain-containing protein [Litoribrevibacter euphylliae]|uniref:RHS repeat-associated core domain-containing protein n=1 Tax=Litoribrevibacter euphylliae TaxID=1834034 RepID=A0ABV7HHX8_9GAMM
MASHGGTTNYSYDSRNRLSTAVANGAVTAYHYFPNNWKDKVVYPNGTEVAYTYDQVGRVDTIVNQQTDDQSLISSFDYDYDDNGNRTEQIEIQNGFAASKQQTTSYVYDDLDRMASYIIVDNDTGNTVETAYRFYPSYDRETEVITETVGGVSTVTSNRSYRYDETNWLTDVTDQDSGKTISYSYDNNGNTLTKLDNIQATPEQTDFSYNSRNQLVKITRGPPSAQTSLGRYDYNYAGMRIRHLGSDRGDIEYIYDGLSILEEVQNNTGSLVAHYRYADRLISLTTPTDSQYYHFATLGTTANLSDANGNVAKSYRTDPYGEITHQEGASVNRQVFTGHEHDDETGLIYMKARFYDPDMARFITQDSYLGQPGTPPSLHRYLYAYGNPTVWVDPTGHVPALDETGQYLMDTGDKLLNMVDEDDGLASTAFFGVTAGANYLVGGVVETVNFGLNILGSEGYLGEGVQDRATEELHQAFDTIHHISQNKEEVASNLVNTVVNEIGGAAAGKRPSQANIIAGATSIFGAGGAAAPGKISQGLGQVGKSIANSKLVISATNTAERAIITGGNRIAEVGKSAASITRKTTNLTVNHAKSAVKAFKDYRSANAYASKLYSISGKYGKQAGAARIAYTKIIRVGKQYVPEIKQFGAHLEKLGKDVLGYSKPVAGQMDSPHAHHIVFKGNFFHRPAMRAALLRSRAVMEKHELNWYSGKENLVWAPNVKGQHTTANAQKVADILETADEVGGKRAVEKALKRIGKEMRNLEF